MYDIDFLRSVGEKKNRRGGTGLIPALFALGLLFFAAEWWFLHDLSRKQGEELARIEERELELAFGDIKQGGGLSVCRRIAEARESRVLWRPVLVALAHALPSGHRFERIRYVREEAALRVEAVGWGEGKRQES